MVSGANQRLAVALAAQCTVLVIMAIRLLGLGGVSHEAVPYTRYSEWGDVMFDVATQAVRREMGRPSGLRATLQPVARSHLVPLLWVPSLRTH